MRMDNDDVQFAHLLPDVILNFKPKFDATPITNDALRASIEQFLADTQRTANNQLKQLFDLVTHMNNIQEIKTEANCFRKEFNLNALTTRFQLTQSLDFYELRYVPLINQRIRNIINDCWCNAATEAYLSLDASLKQIDLSSTKPSLWQEFPSDLPNSLDQALNDDLKMKKLLMKSKGYSAQTIAIVTEFDKKLSEIINEMNILLDEPTTKLEDKQALTEFLRETALKHITEFIAKVREIEINPSDRQSLLFVTRCFCALAELCPHLKMCFCQSDKWRQLLGTTSSGSSLENWQRVCALLEDQIDKFWLQLVNGFFEEFCCERYLANLNTCSVILEDFTVSKNFLFHTFSYSFYFLFCFLELGNHNTGTER